MFRIGIDLMRLILCPVEQPPLRVTHILLIRLTHFIDKSLFYCANSGKILLRIFKRNVIWTHRLIHGLQINEIGLPKTNFTYLALIVQSGEHIVATGWTRMHGMFHRLFSKAFNKTLQAAHQRLQATYKLTGLIVKVGLAARWFKEGVNSRSSRRRIPFEAGERVASCIIRTHLGSRNLGGIRPVHGIGNEVARPLNILLCSLVAKFCSMLFCMGNGVRRWTAQLTCTPKPVEYYIGFRRCSCSAGRSMGFGPITPELQVRC